MIQPEMINPAMRSKLLRPASSFEEAEALSRQLSLLNRAQLARLIALATPETEASLRAAAGWLREHYYGRKVYLRGLIEFSNVCRKDCFYCGIRRSNRNVRRYRLTEAQILACCRQGYELGYRTFVLQSGEDPAFTPLRLAWLVAEIRRRYPDVALTLSVGELAAADYRLLRQAGADRYLLRHETADAAHFASLHPAGQTLQQRQTCLRELGAAGFQVGAGFMVGTPGQTADCLAQDLLFLKELQPQMIGIGPFIPQQDTPLGQDQPGHLRQTLLLLSLLRLLFPKALLPATTAVGTLHPLGRELALGAGANVLMPNLSPQEYRIDYALYDNKICTGDEAAECRVCLQKRVESAGYTIDTGRGDPVDWEETGS